MAASYDGWSLCVASGRHLRRLAGKFAGRVAERDSSDALVRAWMAWVGPEIEPRLMSETEPRESGAPWAETETLAHHVEHSAESITCQPRASGASHQAETLEHHVEHPAAHADTLLDPESMFEPFLETVVEEEWEEMEV